MALRLGKVAFVGGGGGCKVAFSVGVLKALSEADVAPDFASAVSGNTLNFAEYLSSGYKTDGLVKIWKILEDQSQNFLFNRTRLRILAHVLWDTALFSDDGIKALIYGKKISAKEIIHGMNAKALIASPVEFTFSVRNETQNFDSELISNHDPRFREKPELILRYMQASASLAGFLPPILINGEWYSDGLYFDIEGAIRHGCDTIFVLLNDQPPIAHPEMVKWYHRIFFSFFIAHDDMIEARIHKVLEDHKDFMLYDSKSKLPLFQRCMKFWASIAASFKQGDDINFIPHRIITIAPERQIGNLSTLGFDKGDISAAIEHGYTCTKDILEGLKK